MKLSPLAEKQLIEIQYAFGCSKNKAISYALESLHAFENVTDDQIYNHLETNHSRNFNEWMKDNSDNRIKLESN